MVQSSKIHDVESLLEAVRSGVRPEYLFFWGHTASRGHEVDKECLSQWYPAQFKADGLMFPTAEHYMMYQKALLFGDSDTAAQILRAAKPGAVKALGRAVRDYDDDVWSERRLAIVTEGNRAKFSQNTNLRTFLLNTHERILVEASPVDEIWGIGLAADDEHAENPSLWRGLNLLGFALMTVRERLAVEQT